MKRPCAGAPLVAALPTRAEEPPPGRGMTLAEYLAQVGSANLELAAQRLNVPIAEAQIAVARVFPEPVLSGGVQSIDVSGNGSPTSYDVGLVADHRAGRQARLAHRGGPLRDRRRRRATSATSSARCGRTPPTTSSRRSVTRLVVERKQQTLASFERLVAVNAERLRAGDIGQVAYLQSRVEAQRFRGEVLAAGGRRGERAAGARAPAGQLRRRR